MANLLRSLRNRTQTSAQLPEKHSATSLAPTTIVIATLLLSSLLTACSSSSKNTADSETRRSRRVSAQETRPRPEPPYPDSDMEGFEDESAAAKSLPPLVAEQPKRIDEETEIYYYDTNVENVEFSGRKGTEAPKATTKHGDFYYDTNVDAVGPTRTDTEKPISVMNTGEFHYATERSPNNTTVTVRLGMMSPPKIVNETNGITFEDVYGASDVFALTGDYEWRLTSKVGRLGLRFGSGLSFTTGQGRFKNSARAGELPDEQFTFMFLPNTLTALYRFQYAENQVFVPFVEGGGGYYTYMELRDDGGSPKIGGALTTVASAGGSFLLDWIDPKAIRQLDNEYGINHLWLTFDYRVIVGLNQQVDFTSQSINAGVTMEF